MASQVATFKVSVPATNAHCERGLGRLGRWSTPERNRMNVETLSALELIRDDTLNEYVNTKMKQKNNQAAETCLAIMYTLQLQDVCVRRYKQCVEDIKTIYPKLS